MYSLAYGQVITLLTSIYFCLVRQLLFLYNSKETTIYYRIKARSSRLNLLRILHTTELGSSLQTLVLFFYYLLKLGSNSTISYWPCALYCRIKAHYSQQNLLRISHIVETGSSSYMLVLFFYYLLKLGSNSTISHQPCALYCRIKARYSQQNLLRISQIIELGSSLQTLVLLLCYLLR